MKEVVTKWIWYPRSHLQKGYILSFDTSKSISKLVFNIYNCFPYIILGYLFIILGIIGKFGLYPANLGILGIIDGISLFSTILILILNKYVYLIILGLNIFPPISCGVVAKSICVSLLVLLSLVTIQGWILKYVRWVGFK